jgi:SAM-dependent methyltransferase
MIEKFLILFQYFMNLRQIYPIKNHIILQAKSLYDGDSWTGTNVKTILDIGAGKATDLRFWQENNVRRVIAIEPSTDSIAKAKERILKYPSKSQKF